VRQQAEEIVCRFKTFEHFASGRRRRHRLGIGVCHEGQVSAPHKDKDFNDLEIGR
jgi:hypothetical protein